MKNKIFIEQKISLEKKICINKWFLENLCYPYKKLRVFVELILHIGFLYNSDFLRCLVLKMTSGDYFIFKLIVINTKV